MPDNKFFTQEEMKLIPRHIAAIMDGNGRWALRRGLPRTAGHKAGSETFRKAAEFMSDIGVKYFTIYAFSTENWKRPAEEVGIIMSLLEKYLNEAIESMAAKNIRLNFFGDISVLPARFLKLIEKTNTISLSQTGLCVNVCLNYGGRQEIALAAQRAAKDVAEGKLVPEEITPELLSGYMYSAGIPDPDLIIRTSGEQRISNFLLWQSAYSEYYFTDKYWPDMSEAEFAKAIKSFLNRNRRFGGL
ncbi:MAG: isoprenyl transferase [Clostridiaceae bacterium]|nr:isoprenyl transferase [Clostridiaceae bacterium]